MSFLAANAKKGTQSSYETNLYAQEKDNWETKY